VVAPGPSLSSPELAPLWSAVRDRMARLGAERRGRMAVPATMSSLGRYLLGALIDGPVRTTLDLTVLEAKLAELGVGSDLGQALVVLGYGVPAHNEQRRAERLQGRDARRSAREEVATWDEPWAPEWLEGLIRSGAFAGLDAKDVLGLVRNTRAVLARIGASDGTGDRQSRVDLAAGVLGDAHGLDWGTRQASAVTRALAAVHGGEGRYEPWEKAGVNLDLVSAPVLTWGLALEEMSPMARLSAAANALGVPLHISQFALRRCPVRVPEGTDVLVTENPRMVEAACERRTGYAVVALNGNPSSAASLLVHQLLASGASLRYHGDFDGAGLRICARMYRLGLGPWRMAECDYLAAIDEAEAQGAPLPVQVPRCPPTPWDPGLQAAFDKHRKVVHEERLISALLG
jgi:uncharacterized protein (TIGR02679 family)